MKKPFSLTKVGKFLTSPIVKGLITKVPFIGSVAGELLNKTSTNEGTMSKQQMVHHLIKLALYAALFYAGIISFDEFTQA